MNCSRTCLKGKHASEETSHILHTLIRNFLQLRHLTTCLRPFLAAISHRKNDQIIIESNCYIENIFKEY